MTTHIHFIIRLQGNHMTAYFTAEPVDVSDAPTPRISGNIQEAHVYDTMQNAWEAIKRCKPGKFYELHIDNVSVNVGPCIQRAKTI